MKKWLCILCLLALFPMTASQALAAKDPYSIDQAVSDQAQLSTIAFDALAFLTGDAYADSFFPPGKTADYFGFQYMRDFDEAGYGHNTQFLTRAACTVLSILDGDQTQELVTLAKEQAPLYLAFAYNRLPLITAFRLMQKDSTLALDYEHVALYMSRLYELDAQMSIGRAKVTGMIIQSFSREQQDSFGLLIFGDFSSWNENAVENETLKRSMTQMEYTVFMTCASEMLSWYLGNTQSDVYFCPERHGTCFGGFYLKDQPAMNNPDYFISTAMTGDKGAQFLELLHDDQRQVISDIIDRQRDWLSEIVSLRTQISDELRKCLTDSQPMDEALITRCALRYGELEGYMTALYADTFCSIGYTLTTEQTAAFAALRALDVVPQSPYLFSEPIAIKLDFDVDYFFDINAMPEDAGKLPIPEALVQEKK